MIIDNVWLALALFLILMGLAYAAARCMIEAADAKEAGRRWFMLSMLAATTAVSVVLMVMISV